MSSKKLTPPVKPILESSVEDYLDAMVTAAGGMTEKLVTPGRRGPPDRLITWPPRVLDHDEGRMHLAEIKRPKGGVLSEWQKIDHAKRLKYGIKVHLLWTHRMVDTYILVHGH